MRTSHLTKNSTVHVPACDSTAVLHCTTANNWLKPNMEQMQSQASSQLYN